MHWPPRKGDRLWDSIRERSLKSAEGTVVGVHRDWSMGRDVVEGEVTVLFIAGKQKYGSPIWVLTYDGDIHWDRRYRPYPHDGRWYYINLDHSTPNQEVDEYETYDFSELEGNWSSHVGGDGLWSLG